MISCLINVNSWVFRGILTGKVGQTDLVLAREGSLVSLYMQDYKTLCAAVTICSTLINIHTPSHTRTRTHTHTDRERDSILTSLYKKLSQLS